MSDDAAAIRDRHLGTARAALAAISGLDVEAALATTHPALVFELPYERLVEPMDRAGFRRLLTGLRATFRRFAVTVVETVPALDPDTLVLRYEVDALSADGEVAYRNHYIALFGFTDGLISRWREYANPVLTRRMNERLAAVPVEAS